MWHFLINTAYAQATDFGVSYGSYTGLVSTDPRILIGNIVRIALGLLGIIAVTLVIYAGFLWMTAAGESEKIERAKKILIGAIIGLVIVMSAFAVASFVINSLEQATSGSFGGNVNGPGGGPGGLGGGSGAGFRPVGIQPSGTLKKRDVVASVTFSSAPTEDIANIESQIRLELVTAGGRTVIEYNPVIDHNTVRLVPPTPCPDPNATKFCLDADADYLVTIYGGLKSAGGTSTVNCGIGSACTQKFRTGDAVNTQLPTARMTNPTDGQSIRSGSIVQLQSLLTDPDGISGVDYSAGNDFVGSDGSAADLGGGNWSSQVYWDTAEVTPVKSITLYAKVTNIDNDSGNSPGVNVVVRPAHCFDGAKNSDETAIDCGGAECGACTGLSCKVNTDCSTGECVNGQCTDNPKIGDVRLRDGKPGNLVTVSGELFGPAPGKVVFLGGVGDTDDVQGDLSRCPESWRDNTIVVAVPDGAKSGPIKVVTAAGKSDATNDVFGPITPDFTVNDVARPGICTVNPVAAAPKDFVTLGGTGFGEPQGGSRVTFMEASDACTPVGASYDAGAVSPWSNVSAQPKVPNIATGSSGIKALVTVTQGGENSNPVCLQILAPDAGTLPHLDFLSPNNGPVGTYLTLFGSNFGTGGKVKFVKSGQTAYGDTSFPQQCTSNNWDSDNVVVKVPSVFTVPSGTALALGDFAVSLIRSDNSSESNVQTFIVNTNQLMPGICRISPDNGPVGTGTTVFGERLGDLDQSNIAALLSTHPDAVQFSTNQNVKAIGSWTGNAVTMAVPTGSKTGPVVVHTYNGGGTQASNGVNFQVQDCRAAAPGTDVCGAGSSCCADGACRPSGDCSAAANVGGFAWQFSTGPISIYPVVLENATCQATSDPAVMPSPNPFRGTTDVCTDIGMVALRFSLPMDPATAVSANVSFESCGTGDKLGTCVAAVPPGISLTDYGSDTGNLLGLNVNALAPNTWYRLTLKSSPAAGFRSMAAPGRLAQPLDGTFTGKGAGNYVTAFKTGTGPCTIIGVGVEPSNGTITSSSEKLRYKAFPLSSSCVILQCATRTVGWSSSNTGKATVSPTGGLGACDTDASPVEETVPGPTIKIRADVDGKNADADLTVDYTNPAIVDYGPHDCTVACPNTMPFATFNTPMDPNTLTVSAVRVQHCRNESCLAFDGDVAVTPKLEPATNELDLQYAGLLAANTFYRVTIDGTARSTSDAPLTGLNYGNAAFSWIFRTRTDGNPCGVQQVTIVPSVTTLRYIGEVAPVTAKPLTSPDACSATGQLLTTSSFNWNWTSSQSLPTPPETFSIKPYEPNPIPARLDTNPILASSCTAQCLNAGSAPAGTAVCGDGKSGTGEACDTPGVNGCTNRCLMIGNSDKGTGQGQCGDKRTDSNMGESCDAGAKNGLAGSGCDANCLLTGSSPGVSKCGNGSIGVGEECDDDNANSGDGCSSSCLLEGSDKDVTVCGDGILGDGESCEYAMSGGQGALFVPGQIASLPISGDPKNPSFPCTDRCLLRGNVNAGTKPSQCGDGVIDPTKGESCDAGAGNGEAGYGCSASCLKTGSDALMRSFCGDKIIGGGEECDALSTDGKIDPVQYVTAKAECDGKNSCTGSVAAAVDTVLGNGSVAVECSCQTDSDCTIFDGSLACGAGACCFKRPRPPVITPTESNQCRNVLVSIDFQEAMNAGTLTGNIVVYQQGGNCTPPFAFNGDGAGWFSKLSSAAKSLTRKVFGKDAAAAECAAVTGTMTNVTAARADGTTHTLATFAPKQLYDAGTGNYTVAIKGGANGVKTANGVGYGNTITQDFSGGAKVCKLDAVQVTGPSGSSTEMIQSSGRAYTFLAKFLSTTATPATELASIQGVYDWTSAWSTVQNPTGLLTTSNETLASIDVTTTTNDKGVAQNGTAQIIAIATLGTVPDFPGLDPSGSKKSGKADVTVMLCENLWPARHADGTWTPYVDPETHFKLFYCRDSASGTLLPTLSEKSTQAKVSFGQGVARFCANTKAPGESNQLKACSSDADCGGANSCVPKDQLLLFTDARLRDAIGIRVFTDVERLSPQDWYADQKFTAALTATTVDGYQAGTDGRTAYVVAADKYGDPELRPYVYVLGYNDGASADTVAIYKQLLANMAFNVNMSSADVVNVCKLQDSNDPIQDAAGKVYQCSTDLDCLNAVPNPQGGMSCDAPKDKLRRDMKRWQDLHVISNALSELQQQAGEYPKIESGSYIKGMTTSKWPSWTSLLGAAGSVTDPINDFLACDKYGSACSVTGQACTSTAECDKDKADDICQPKFDPETCYSNKTDLFLCPAGSHIYRYNAIGGADYQLNAELEFSDVPWAQNCGAFSSQDSCGLRTYCRWTGTACQDRITTAPSCGGLFNTTPLKCNGTGSPCAQDSECSSNQLCLPSGSAVFGNAVNPRCGNSVVEPGEACESGMATTVSCSNGGASIVTCTSNCQWSAPTCGGAAVCGNGATEPHESCDDGTRNGTYGMCRSGQDKGCSKRCINTTPRGSFTGADVSLTTCTTNADCATIGTNQVCTDRYQFCGDGVRNGSESCDEGADNGTYGRCAWDCSGPGPRCGDSAVNGAEQCDGTQDTKPGVCVAKGTTIADASTAPTTAVGCSQDSDCASGQVCAVCGSSSTGLPQNRAHSCNAPGATNQCLFAGWGACKPSGACGNNKIEGAEQCDDGSANSATGACLPSCRKNVCGDGFVFKDTEQCDLGASNGVACTAPYGTTCSYCKTDCTVVATSGLYCGDSSPTVPVNAPPEMCDPGRIAKWCSKTYLSLLHPYALTVPDPYPTSPPATVAAGPKSCNATSDCTAGHCQAYYYQPLAARNASCQVKGSPTLTCVPDASNVSLCDITKCKCPPGYAFNASTFKCEFKPPQVKAGYSNTTPCNSSVDCDTNTQYCASSQGECLAYNSQCTPDAFSNTYAASTALNYHDGNCVGCSNSCAVVNGKSPYYCGDSIVQSNFGEQCEETGDPGATGPSGTGTYYGCGKGCSYDTTSHYCGDNRLDVIPAMGVNEACDGTSLGSVAGKSCAYYNWGSAGAVSCGASCKPYGGGCSDGDLSPGDVRIRVLWKQADAGSDYDTHILLPTGASQPNVGYAAGGGAVDKDPHVWWSWDDTSASKGNNVAPTLGFSGVHGLELMTANWRADGKYWPSTPANPYKLYIYEWSGTSAFKNMAVQVCVYKLGLPKNADCDTYTYRGPTSAAPGPFWHVADFYGTDQSVPVVVRVNKFSSCPTTSTGIVARGTCPANGL